MQSFTLATRQYTRKTSFFFFQLRLLANFYTTSAHRLREILSCGVRAEIVDNTLLVASSNFAFEVTKR